jgi:VWFA-related protein
VVVVSAHAQQPSPLPLGSEAEFRFKSGVELVNVTATVFDPSGRFVPDLRKDDFVVYEDDQPQDVTHFSAERVPVSLGIVLDTSGSMTGEKIRSAQNAIDTFLYDLLDSEDEIFLYRFSNVPALIQSWTTDREVLARALARVSAAGGTAMYDAVAAAIPLAAHGRNPKKAVVVISDGNDTASRADIRQLKQLIRGHEVLVYAIGIECGAEANRQSRSPQFQRRGPIPIPSPFPPGGRRGWPVPPRPTTPPRPQGRTWNQACGDPVDAGALREMTDDSGGRTEIVRNPRDLNPATAGIADELSKQYYLGYPSSGKRDGRWHAIRVEVRDQQYRIRARRGYVAS